MSEQLQLTSNPEQTSPLLRLPPELRNRIYHSLFCPRDEEQEIFELTETSLSPALLCTSRQIRAECSGIFYANTILQFNEPSVLIRRLTTLPPKIIDLIPEIRYDTSEICVKASSWRTAFRELPGLDEDTKLEALREELKKQEVELKMGVLRARIRIGCRGVWSSDPLSAALDAVKQGELNLVDGWKEELMADVERQVSWWDG